MEREHIAKQIKQRRGRGQNMVEQNILGKKNLEGKASMVEDGHEREGRKKI